MMFGPRTQSTLNRIRYSLLPNAKVGICRVRHDKESPRIRGNGKFPYLSRFYDPNIKQPRGLPETVRFNGGKGVVVLSKEWQQFFADNNTPQAQAYLKRKQSGWVNYGPWPKVEQIICGGSYVVVYFIQGTKAYIQTYDNAFSPKTYYDVDYLNRFNVVYTDDSLSDPPCGKAYTLAIKNPTDYLWIHIDDLTFLRHL